MNTDFPLWLQSEMNSRGWSQSELARRAEITPTTISRVINHERLPGVDFCKGVARALGLRDVEVMRHAGLADPEPITDTPSVRELLADFNSLSDEDQVAVLEHAKSLRALRGQQARRKKATT